MAKFDFRVDVKKLFDVLQNFKNFLTFDEYSKLQLLTQIDLWRLLNAK